VAIQTMPDSRTGRPCKDRAGLSEEPATEAHAALRLEKAQKDSEDAGLASAGRPRSARGYSIEGSLGHSPACRRG